MNGEGHTEVFAKKARDRPRPNPGAIMTDTYSEISLLLDKLWLPYL